MSIANLYHTVRDLIRRGFYEEAIAALDELEAEDCDTARRLALYAEEDGSLLCWAALGQGSKGIMARLIALGANADCCCGSDYILTPLVTGDSEFGLSTAPEIEYLVSQGANPNAIAVGAGSYPMLHFAIRHDKVGAALALLRSGADPLLPTTETGLSAIDVARRFSRRALAMLETYSREKPGVRQQGKPRKTGAGVD